VRGQIWKFWKTPLRACSQGQVASLCQFLSTSDMPDPNDKPKSDFGAKFGQIFTFDLSVRGQICKFWKNAVTGWFPVSSCFTVPIFIHIELAGSERPAKTWFRVKIRSNFYLWPLRARSNLKILKNAVTGLFPGSSCFTVPIFVHIGHAGSKRQAKKWFRGKIRSNFDIWPLRARSNLQILKKRHYGLVPSVKLLHCANFCPHRTCRIRTTSQNVISGQN
jgi:hypothetical protein